MKKEPKAGFYLPPHVCTFEDLSQDQLSWLKRHQNEPEITAFLKAGTDKLMDRAFTLYHQRPNESNPRIVLMTGTRFRSFGNRSLIQLPMWDRNQASFPEATQIRRLQTARTVALDPNSAVLSYASLGRADRHAHRELGYEGMETIPASDFQDHVAATNGFGFEPYIRLPNTDYRVTRHSNDIHWMLDVMGKVARGIEIKTPWWVSWSWKQ